MAVVTISRGLAFAIDVDEQISVTVVLKFFCCVVRPGNGGNLAARSVSMNLKHLVELVSV
nr:hypothetical protein [Duganella sp. Root198D2]